MTFGICPRSARTMGQEWPLDSRAPARVQLYNFMAASKWMLGPLLLAFPSFLGGAAARGLALRHLAVSTTTAAWMPAFVGMPISTRRSR